MLFETYVLNPFEFVIPEESYGPRLPCELDVQARVPPPPAGSAVVVVVVELVVVEDDVVVPRPVSLIDVRLSRCWVSLPPPSQLTVTESPPDKVVVVDTALAV
jgi:hypothetical protein